VEPLYVAETPTEKDSGLIRLNMTKDKLDNTLLNALDVVIQYLISEDVKLYDNTTAEELYAKVNKNQSLSVGSSSHILDSALMINPSTSSIVGSQPSVAMMRSSSDTIYTSSGINSTNNNPSPPQAYQFFNFNNNETNIPTNMNLNTTNNNPTNNNPLDSSWNTLMQQGPMPTVSTSGQSNGSSKNSDNNIRAIFEAPMDLTDQERVVLSNYRYQRMSVPPATNFGFPQPVPTNPTGDIWSTPSQINRRSTGFPTNNMTNPPSTSRSNYSSNPQNDGMQQMRVSTLVLSKKETFIHFFYRCSMKEMRPIFILA
jgi:hypothetical protein